MKCGLTHLGCGILDFSVLNSLFFSFEALHSLFFSFEGLLVYLINWVKCKNTVFCLNLGKDSLPILAQSKSCDMWLLVTYGTYLSIKYPKP